MAFAITDGSRKFVYSGDAAICPALVDLCSDADFLLHWCYRLDGETLHPALDVMTPTPSDIARMAERCRVKHLALTHIRVHMDEPRRHEAARAAMKAVFEGPSEIAEDLTVYEI